MDKLKGHHGFESHMIECVEIELHSAGRNGACFDTLAGKYVPVTLEYDFIPAGADGDEENKARVTIKSARLSGATFFDSDSTGVLSYSPGFDMLRVLNEVEIEALEEMLLKKLEAQ